MAHPLCRRVFLCGHMTAWRGLIGCVTCYMTEHLLEQPQLHSQNRQHIGSIMKYGKGLVRVDCRRRWQTADHSSRIQKPPFILYTRQKMNSVFKYLHCNRTFKHVRFQWANEGTPQNTSVLSKNVVVWTALSDWSILSICLSLCHTCSGCYREIQEKEREKRRSREEKTFKVLSQG